MVKITWTGYQNVTKIEFLWYLWNGFAEFEEKPPLCVMPVRVNIEWEK